MFVWSGLLPLSARSRVVYTNEANYIMWQVLDLLEDACESLLDSILAENKHILDP